jgi:hypothetical protein
MTRIFVPVLAAILTAALVVGGVLVFLLRSKPSNPWERCLADAGLTLLPNGAIHGNGLPWEQFRAGVSGCRDFRPYEEVAR